MTNAAPVSTPVLNEELRAYLQSRPKIVPLKQIFKDATFKYNTVSFITSAMMIPSGLNDRIVGTDQANFFRVAQGVGALANISLSTFLMMLGRYQTYSDLRDLQDGVDPAIIMARADAPSKGAAGYALNWAMANTVNITAGIAIGLLGLMAISGFASRRPGEALTALLWLPGYLARFLPEKSKSAPPQPEKKRGWLSQKFHDATTSLSNSALGHSWVGRKTKQIAAQPPLFLASLYKGIRRVPAFGNAVWVGDAYQAIHIGGGWGMDIFLAEVDKRGFGRFNGSLLDKNRQPDGADIAKNILEGRGTFRTMKEIFSPKV